MLASLRKPKPNEIARHWTCNTQIRKTTSVDDYIYYRYSINTLDKSQIIIYRITIRLTNNPFRPPYLAIVYGVPAETIAMSDRL